MNEHEGRTQLDPARRGAEPSASDTTSGRPIVRAGAPRRGLDATDHGQVSVAELPRQVGHHLGGRHHRHAEADPPGAANTAAAVGATGGRPVPTSDPAVPVRDRPLTHFRPPAGRRTLDDDTVVFPAVVVAEHAPLGGASPPQRRRSSGRLPRTAQPHRPVPAPAVACGTDGTPPTRLQAKKSRRQHQAALAARVAVALTLVAIGVLAVTGTGWPALS